MNWFNWFPLVFPFARLDSEENVRENKLRDDVAEADKRCDCAMEYMARVTHELRTPLNCMMGMIHLLNAKPLDDESKNLLVTMRQSAENMLGLVDDLLDYARLEHRQMPIEERPFCMKTLIETVHNQMQPLAVAKGLTLSHNAVVFNGGAPLSGDARRIKQILINLVSNAIKYTDKGSVEVRCDLRDVGDKVMTTLWVKDTGVGIAPERLGSIFKPFEQNLVDDQHVLRRGKSYAGTGLGLAICHELVTRMNGDIGVISQLGEGANFWVSLPLARAAAVQEKRQKHDKRKVFRPKVKAEKARVLVAEDHPLNQVYFRHLLEGFGIGFIDMVAKGDLVVPALAKGDFDMALLDEHLPVKNGSEVAREWRKYEKEHNRGRMALISVSAVCGDIQDMQARRAGVDGCVSKPIDPEMMHEMMSEWIELPPNPFKSCGRQERATVINLDQLREFCVDDPEGQRSLIEMFMMQGKEQVEQLHELAARDTHEQWQDVAHKLKGGAGCMGAEGLRRIAELCQNSNPLNDDEYKRYMDKVDREFKAVCQALDAELAKLPKDS